MRLFVPLSLSRLCATDYRQVWVSVSRKEQLPTPHWYGHVLFLHRSAVHHGWMWVKNDNVRDRENAIKQTHTHAEHNLLLYPCLPCFFFFTHAMSSLYVYFNLSFEVV